MSPTREGAMKIARLLIAVAILGGCATYQTYAPRLPVRDFLIAEERPALGYGAYGYVLFTRESSPATQARDVAFCEAFMRGMVSAGSYPDVARANLMPTYWLLKRDVRRDDAGDCKELVSQYNLAHAKPHLSAVQRLAADGPVLVAWRTREPISGEEALVFDLSRLTPNDFPQALGLWQDRIARNPAVWNNGFLLERIRLDLRAFVQTYGATIIQVVRKG